MNNPTPIAAAPIKKKAYEKQLSVMIISDFEEEVAVINAHLAKHSITIADWNRTGVGWLERWKRTKPFIVFIDHILPKREGMECINLLKKAEKAASIVYMHSFTGFTANLLERRVFDMGVAGIVAKPICDMRFQQMLKRLIDLAT